MEEMTPNLEKISLRSLSVFLLETYRWGAWYLWVQIADVELVLVDDLMLTFTLDWLRLLVHFYK